MPSKSFETLEVFIPKEKFANQASAWLNGFDRGVDAGFAQPEGFHLSLQNPERLEDADKIANVASCAASCTEANTQPSFSHPLGYASRAIFVLNFAPLAYTVGKTIYNVADKYIAYRKALAELGTNKEMAQYEHLCKLAANEERSLQSEQSDREENDVKHEAAEETEGGMTPFEFESIDKSVLEALD